MLLILLYQDISWDLNIRINIAKSSSQVCVICVFIRLRFNDMMGPYYDALEVGEPLALSDNDKVRNMTTSSSLVAQICFCVSGASQDTVFQVKTHASLGK